MNNVILATDNMASKLLVDYTYHVRSIYQLLEEFRLISKIRHDTSNRLVTDQNSTAKK